MWLEVIGVDWACEREWLVDWVQIDRRVDDQLHDLSGYLTATWPVVDLLTGKELRRQPLSVVGVDARHFTDEVYEFVRPRQVRGWAGRDDQGRPVGCEAFAMMGTASRDMENRSFKIVTPEREMVGMRNGVAVKRPDAINLVLINKLYWRRVFFDEMRAELLCVKVEKGEENQGTGAALEGLRPSDLSRGGLAEAARCAPGNHRSPEAGERQMRESPELALGAPLRQRKLFFPDDTPKNYFDQLTSEEEKTVISRSGERVKVWRTRPGRIAGEDHALDCRVGGKCLRAAFKVKEQLAAEAIRRKNLENAKKSVSV